MVAITTGSLGILSEREPYDQSMTSTDAKITIYSDYVCPFCYLGRRSLEAYQETRDRDLEIDWQPYDLRSQKRRPDGEIDHSVDDGKDEAYFEQVRENVSRLKDEYDAEEMLDIDEIPETVDSLQAQVASFYVNEEHPDKWPAFDEAIFEALWIDGRDIGDVDVLADLADGFGLDGDEIRTAITDDRYRERLREEFTEAREAGVTAVPTFVYDGHGARGAVPPEQLERLVEGT
jgi:predicted DsbA family dithiol-disulfide isomerase